MLEGSYKLYRTKADEIDWKKYDCNDLFFKYIEHENDQLSENYFAGIVCRYWGYAGRIYLQCKKHIAFEECHDCIIDAIRYVLKKRVWENKNSSLYNDKKGPDKAMHIAMKRQKSLMLSKYNAYKRLSEFNTLSIDAVHEDYNDASDGLLFDLESSEIDKMRIYIAEYFDSGKILEGLLLDAICYNNYKDYSSKNILKHIKNLDKKDYVYYDVAYNLNKELYFKELLVIKDCDTKTLELKLNSLLYSIRKEVF